MISSPHQTVLVSCRAHLKKKFSEQEETKDNIIAIDWHMPTALKPMFYAIAVGKTRYSYNLIKKSKVFAVNFMPFSKKDEVLYCGRNSGETIDKFKETGLHKEEADTIDCPRINEALGYLECEVVSEIETGDHVIFVGKALKHEQKKEGKRIFHLDDNNFITLEG
jgi:flavin reductase (DIM6/NTAB) family NADH-FMN oxidoreductase RutF